MLSVRAVGKNFVVEVTRTAELPLEQNIVNTVRGLLCFSLSL